MHFLSQVFHFFTTSANWWGSDGILDRLALQAELSAVVVAIAGLIGVGLGFYLGHIGRGGFIAVNSANAARAVPSLALLTLLAIQPSIGFAGNGFLAAAITLVALAIPPILTNAYVAMRDVDPDLREASRSLGMSSAARFFKVEVPLALPLTIAGVRTAAVEVVATSTLAAFVTFNDLGEYIFSGLAQQDSVETFSGALLVAVLAGVTDLLVTGLFYFVTPVALRRGGSLRPEVRRGAIAGATSKALERIRQNQAVLEVAGSDAA
jgi:osmoprotectant transport system permease protein